MDFRLDLGTVPSVVFFVFSFYHKYTLMQNQAYMLVPQRYVDTQACLHTKSQIQGH
jgi:hypothetical protein